MPMNGWASIYPNPKRWECALKKLQGGPLLKERSGT